MAHTHNDCDSTCEHLQQENASLHRRIAALEAEREQLRAASSNDSRFRLLIEHIADPVVVICQGIVEFVNPAAEMLFQRTANEMVGQELGIPLVAHDKAEVDIFRGHGVSLVAEMRLVELNWEGCLAYLATFRDITSQKKQESDMEQRVAERTALLQHTMRQLSTELAERENAERAILRRDAILEAIEFAAHRFLKNDSFTHEIPVVLEYFGKATMASRVSLFTIQPENNDVVLESSILVHTTEKTSNSITSLYAKPPLRTFSRWKEQLRRGFSLHGNVRTFPFTERKELEAEKIHSIVVVPIFVEHEWWGFIEFDETQPGRVWLLAEVEALRAAASMIGTAYQHERVLQALRNSEEQFRTVADYTYNWEYWIDSANVYQYVSPSCERITGYTPDEFYADPNLLLSIIHHEDKAAVIHHLQEEQDNNSFEITFRLLHRNGEVRWIGHACQPIMGLHGERRGRRGSNRDITERKIMEEALRQSESKFRSIIEQSTDGINLADEKGILIEWNHGAEHITGLKRNAVIGKYYWDVLFSLVPKQKQSNELYHQARMELQTFFKTGQAIWLNGITEQQYQHINGNILYAQQICFSIPTNKGYMACAIFRDITEQKKAEDALRYNEERFREFIEGTDDVITLMDGNGAFTYINQAAERIYGISMADAIGVSMFDFVHPADTVRTHTAFEGWLKRKATNVTFENRQVSHHGMTHYILWTINLHYNGTGTITKINAIGRDITSYKNIEHALRESETRYRVISELISDFAYSLLVDKDTKLHLEWVTDAFARVTGFTLNEFQQRGDWYCLIHPDDKQHFKQHVMSVLEGQTINVNEFRIITREGSIRWLRNHSRPMWDKAQRRVARIYGGARDITERKQTQEALRQSEEKFRSIIEQSSDGINLADERGIVIEWNHGAEHITGLLHDAVVGRTYWDILYDMLPDDRKGDDVYRMTRDGLLMFFETGEAPWINHITEQRFRHVNGSLLYAQQLCFAIQTNKGYMACSIFRDITERKHAEEAYRTLVDHSLQGLAIIQKKRIVFANPMMTTITGYSNEELLAFSHTELAQLIHADDKAMVWNSVCKVLAGAVDIPERYTFRVRRRDGAVRWLDMSVTPTQYHAGFALQAACIDSTEQHEAEDTLRRAKTELEVRVAERTAELLQMNIALQEEIAERQRAEEHIRHHAARTEALAHMAARLNAQIDLATVLQHVCEEVAAVLHVCAVVVSLYDNTRDVFVQAYSVGIDDAIVAQCAPLPRVQVATRVEELGHAHVIEDICHHHDMMNHDVLCVAGVRTLAEAAVLRDGTMVALIQTMSIGQTRLFTNDELTLLQAIADQTAQAITNAQLFDAVQQERTMLAQRMQERTTTT